MKQETVDAANNIKQRLASAHDQIRTQKNLSDAGRTARMAKAQLDAQNELDALRADDATATANQRAADERTLHGIGSTDPAAAISYRDALDRARAIDHPDKALKQLQRADQIGDEHLARAVATHAADQDWPAVLDAYVATRPGAAAALDRLRATDAAAGSTMDRLNTESTFTAPFPAEIRHIPRSMLPSVAAQADDPDNPQHDRATDARTRLRQMWAIQ